MKGIVRSVTSGGSCVRAKCCGARAWKRSYTCGRRNSRPDMGSRMGKIRALLRDFWGVTVSAGGLAQGLTRLGAYFADEVEHIQQALRRSAVVNADETGLRVAGSAQWLWVFMSDVLTLAQVEASRGQDVVLKTLGPDFSGVLGCDFYAAYNALECPKQRCLVHLLRAVREALQVYEQRPGRKPQFLLDLKAWIKAALDLGCRRATLSQQSFEQERDLLEEQLQHLLYSRVTNADGLRLRLRLWRNCEELLTFLYTAGVDGSNNQVERAIRPIVAHRRMNGGHRSPRGANALAAILSVYRSCQQQGRDFIRTGMDIVTRHLHGLPPGVLVPDS